MEPDFHFEAIGRIESPYREKFGIPRQSGLVPAARGRLILLPPYDCPEALAGLETTSHLWLLFVFHDIGAGSWRPRVRPPRLGGNKRVGVFATRSGFRPNPIGLSVVKLEGIRCDGEGVSLSLSGLDLLDGTPVLDIKPYIPYADALSDASSALAPAPPGKRLAVIFDTDAEAVLAALGDGEYLRSLIAETLTLDPRPAYKGEADEKEYGMRLGGWNVRWRLNGKERVRVTDIEPG
ncbi:MAG: tRNA (N6-threonylcarbamoyladenosine(37)-N6)-methyltransferase TrmO [Gammaproteobacteria bacterium]|nr:tRNA (N6-threonylcarbamoyladenosine(37)-N6)-methyltransferase TrmO [Gammaproteobacteria bacterium]MBU1655820.1 tRNA (N6-threonylcarbamoyladenosine(37)-N6)-methyltransferase TrmO [Gammaproteobacteria bacterium]MBU1962400.1 tRNA (N6-threonylcarbamoyladenosine(37)-N6)-methyltransferase TrmO [Gammaproteobacteria bacterium]